MEVIVLILRVENLDRITQYRTISLCNVLYKVVYKMTAFLLKLCPDDNFALVLSALVPGHLITDNILLAYVCIHTINNRRKGKEGYCVVMLDMHKAYDCVE
jgi:hypothetical protein